MPYYKKKKVLDDGPPSRRQVTSRPTWTKNSFRPTRSGNSSSTTKSYAPRRPATTFSAAATHSTSIPFGTRLRQLEATNRMASIRCAQAQALTGDTKSMECILKSLSPIPLPTTSSAQPFSSIKVPVSPLEPPTRISFQRHHTQQFDESSGLDPNIKRYLDTFLCMYFSELQKNSLRTTSTPQQEHTTETQEHS